MLFRAAISIFALDLRSQWSQGAVCPCLQHLRPFYCISLKKYFEKWYIFYEGGSGGRKLTKGGGP